MSLLRPRSPAHLAIAASLLVPASLLAAPSVGWASEGGSARDAGVGARGRPLPEVRSFVVTEVGVWFQLDEDPVSGGNDGAIACDVGWLRNLDGRNALGAVVFSEAGGFVNLGAKARYRRWLGRTASIDFSPGVVLVSKDDSSADLHPPMPVATLSLNAGDVVSVGVHVQRGRYEHWDVPSNRRAEFWDTTWRVGGRFGATPGTIGAALYVAAAILYLNLMDWDG